MNNWYVITAKTGRELTALDELTQAHIEAYCPVRRLFRFNRQLRKNVTVERGAIPGYLFVTYCDWNSLRDKTKFPATGRPLASANGPVLVPAAIVDGIRADEAAGAFDDVYDTKARRKDALKGRFHKGDKYRVGAGTFASFDAVVEAVTAQGRIRALVNIFNRMVAVELEPEQLEAA